MGAGDVRGDMVRPRRIEVADVESVLSDIWDNGGTILDAPSLDEHGSLMARFADAAGDVITVVQRSRAFVPHLLR